LRQPPVLPSDAQAPHVIVVQSESFFDPRHWSEAIAPEVLTAWDDTCSTSLCHGRLQVPAWGANTVRTEAAFLTGLDPVALGIHRFAPYRALARQPVPNLFNAMKQLGYRTVAVHPYPASFYLRDRVFPMLGVDHFLDITDFDPEERDGQYISDAAVARKVGRLLKDKDNAPLFIFAITMENHGPLHLERPSAEDAARLSPPGGPLAKQPDCRDLLVYLRRSPESCLRQIRERGRDYERRLPEGYLGGLARRYDRWFEGYDRGASLRVDADRYDFLGSEADLGALVAQIADALPQQLLFF
jgi:hypothetical protein